MPTINTTDSFNSQHLGAMAGYRLHEAERSVHRRGGCNGFFLGVDCLLVGCFHVSAAPLNNSAATRKELATEQTQPRGKKTESMLTAVCGLTQFEFGLPVVNQHDLVAVVVAELRDHVDEVHVACC